MEFEKLSALIAEQFGIDPAEITENTSFEEDLHADSLDLVELVMAMENEFGFGVAEEDIENIRTVGDACVFIKEHME